jgi:predicted RNA-binding Zn ribbon-like protein
MADSEFLLLGDALWLEFVNTAGTPPGDTALLTDPGAYLRWAKAVRVEAEPGATAFQEALGFRGQLVNLARALDAGRNPPPSAIEAVNTRLLTLEGRQQLLRIGGAWRFRFAPNRPPTALEAIAQSAAQTLANPLSVVRHCANPGCALYFADDSPNQTRRWCSRSRCGQRGRIERRRATRPTPLLSEG